MAGGVFTGGGATVVMDPPPLVYAKVFRRGGEPDGFLLRRAERVAATAKVLAPHRTYRLRSSIHASRNRDELGRYAFGYAVNAQTPYAYYVHEGTGPSIRTANPPGAMRFPGTNGYLGQTVYTKVVHHPGTPAQPFLVDALIAMVGR